MNRNGLKPERMPMLLGMCLKTFSILEPSGMTRIHNAIPDKEQMEQMEGMGKKASREFLRKLADSDDCPAVACLVALGLATVAAWAEQHGLIELAADEAENEPV